jgi:two-component system NtrC family response regulator
VLDCSAVTPDLVTSELFGHVEGAFTGACRRRVGAFESANGGTLFLDEVGELPLDVQPKLLRALESREVRPLGSTAVVRTDVRVVAATHRGLETMVACGEFRGDLYYRLAVVRVDLPPLRHRTADIPGLVRHLLDGLGGGASRRLTERALEVLSDHAWPGNVRELRNVIERTVALSDGSVIDAADLALEPAYPPVETTEQVGTLLELERRPILKALAQTAGNQKEAARLLGVHRNTMRNRLKAHGIVVRRGQPVSEDDST